MLALERREGESIFITLSDDIDPSTPVGEVFSEPIEIKFYEKRGNKIALAIQAPQAFYISRGEWED